MAVIHLDDHRPMRRRRPSGARLGSSTRQIFCEYPSKAPEGRTGLLRRWRQRLRHRAALRRELLPQPDSVLEDAGLTREEAVSEANKPFWRA